MSRYNRGGDGFNPFKIAGAAIAVVLITLFAIKVLPPLAHAVNWYIFEPKPTPVPSIIEQAAAPPIDAAINNNDIEPRLTGYIYEFPEGTVDWKITFTSTVAFSNGYQSQAAYNEFQITYLCLMFEDIILTSAAYQHIPKHPVWRSCQPVVREAK